MLPREPKQSDAMKHASTPLRALTLCALSISLLSPAVWAGSLEQSRDALRSQGCPGYTQFLRKQAAAGDAWSQAQLFSLDVIVHPCGDPGRAATSVARLLDMAAQGNPAAKTRAGQAYLQGRAIPKDTAKAMALLREASAQGETGATFNLGLAHLFGWAGERDPQAARALFEKLAAGGHLYGDLGMGLLTLQGEKPDTRAGYGWLEKAARKGDPYAQRLLGNAYEQGVGDLKQDYVHAAQYYRDAAGLMDWPAQLALGRLTLRGQGVKKDALAAARLFEAAASQGGTEAEAQIAQAYFDGAEGTPPDYAAAAPWLARAAQAGDAGSAKLLGWLNETGSGVAKSEAEARRLYRQASDLGDNWSAFRFYQMLYSAKMTPAEQDAALAQLERAATLGHGKALLILAQIYDQGGQRPRDKARAAQLWRAAADAGEMVGMFNLGVAYDKGEGVPQSAQQAAEWFAKASVAGYAPAFAAYKSAYMKAHPDRIAPDVYSLAQAGSADARNELAETASTPEDRLKWTQRAAESGNAFSQYRLGGFYLNGVYVEKDLAQARKWLLRSADGGYWGGYDALAQIAAGKLGGQPPDAEAAKRWYRTGIERIRDKTGNNILSDNLDTFLKEERLARLAEEAERARRERQAGNLPPESSDIYPLMVSAWDRHLNRGRLQSDGTFSKTDPLMGVEWARTEMWVEDVSCVKDAENNKCGGYKCSFATRQRAVGGLAGIFAGLAEAKTTRYQLHFHWTRDGLEAPNLDKVMAEQAEVERARARAARASSYSSSGGDDWQAQQQKAWCAGMGWSSSKSGQFAYDMLCP